MSDRPRRPRITPKENILIAIEDVLEFKKNNVSDKARKISTVIRNTHIDIWFDKHYHDRHQHGDENGKREGIGNEIVEDLVKRSVRLLLFYSNIINGFSFLNGPGIIPNRRVILREALDETMLNVVIEVYMIDVVNYELTVRTAMCVDGFRIQDGQFVIDIDGDHSSLKKCEVGKLKEILAI